MGYLYRYNWQYSFVLPVVYTFATVLVLSSRPFPGFSDPLVLFNCFFTPLFWLTMLTDRQMFDGHRICQISYILVRKCIPIHEVVEIRYAPALIVGNYKALYITGTHATITVNEIAYSPDVLRNIARALAKANPRIRIDQQTHTLMESR